MMRNANPGSVPARRRAGAAVGLVALLGVSGLGLGRGMAATNSGAASCEDRPTVSVSTTPEMYGPVTKAASRVEASGTVCARYDVQQQASGDVADQIKESSDAIPDVWIPDSRVWADTVNEELGSGWLTAGQTIATSPVVMAVPESLKSNKAVREGAGWGSVLDGDIPVQMADPRSSTASLMTVVTASQHATKSQRTSLLSSFLRLSRTTSSEDTLFQRSAGEAKFAGVFPTSEQQLRDYNERHRDHPDSVLVPREGAAQLSYTWVTPVRGTPPPSVALEALRGELTSATTKSDLRRDGFRVSGEQPPSGSAVPADVKVLGDPGTEQSQAALTAWNNLRMDARMLVLVDASGSMQTKAGKESRLQVLQGFTHQALKSLPQTTSIGAWGFTSSNVIGNGRDYLPIANPAPLTDTAHKEKLSKAIDTTLPKYVKKDGDTGLYDSIAAAYSQMERTYDSRYINSIVVLTDGKNDDPEGGLNLQQLLKKLRGSYDPKKPVKIVAISMGPDTDPAALKQIASSTDGLDYVAKDPRQITSVFIDAFLRRGQ